MADTSAIVSMGIFTTAVNMYGAVKNNRSSMTALMGSFIVTFILLVIGETKASKMALAFAFAFMVSSLALNANDLLSFVNATVNSSKTLGAEQRQNQQNVKSGAYAHVDSWDRANISNQFGNADSWNR